MLLPYRTDAPVYHGPWATIGVIIANLIIQVWASATDYEYVEPFLAQYGTFMPHQWLTSVFLHSGWMHLIGNMIFLWVFGLIVEGKIGWWRFLALYGAIAVLAGAVEQLIMLGGDGGSLGASGVIFGLLAIAMLWAPDNEIDSLLLLYGVKVVELPIKVFAGIYLALQLLDAVLDGFAFGTAVLHLLGAAAGLPIGILMLKRGWVDCEGWDWFSRRNRHRAPASSARKPAAAGPAPAPAAARDDAALDAEFRSSFEELLAAGKAEAAAQVWREHDGGRWGVPIVLRERLVGVLVKAQNIREATPFIDGILAEKPDHAGMGLLRAQLLLRDRRPAAAIECLDRIGGALGDERQRSLDRRLREQAAQLQAEGVLEMA